MLGKTCSVFGENRLRFWMFLGQTGSVFEKNKLQFWDNWLRFGVEIGSVFGLAWDKAQVSLF